jgi:hypothetical protein
MGADVETDGKPGSPITWKGEYQGKPYEDKGELVEADGEVPFLIGGKALRLKRHFIEDVRAADLKERIRTLRRALLVMHSPTDNTVGIAHASEIFRTARHPRSFVSLEGADHPPQRQESGRAGGPHHQRLGRPVSVTRARSLPLTHVAPRCSRRCRSIRSVVYARAA